MPIRALLVLCSLIAFADTAPSFAETGAQRREKAEVLRLFRFLLSFVEGGDGWAYDKPCIFGERWEEMDPDILKKLKLKKKLPLLTLREALDPDKKSPEKFCDLMANNLAAADAVRNSDDPNARIVTADTKFTYPIFSRDFTRAWLQKTSSNIAHTKDHKGGSVMSTHTIFLTKRNGKWNADFRMEFSAH